jgi:hypothetical protein
VLAQKVLAEVRLGVLRLAAYFTALAAFSLLAFFCFGTRISEAGMTAGRAPRFFVCRLGLLHVAER